jgi:hypothetical protein
MAFDMPLPAAALDIRDKIRSNLLPWRGQFSPQLVEALLRAYAVPSSVVLDPFMGSGTVLVESARLGFEAHGYEVNPAAFALARVYELCQVKRSARGRLVAEADAIVADLASCGVLAPKRALRRDPAAPVMLKLLELARATTDAPLRTLLEALGTLIDRPTTPPEGCRQRWESLRRTVLGLPETSSRVVPCLGDARKLHMPAKTVGFVLSSPPYINVFNYHHNYRSAIESLGWLPLVVARSEVGSNRKFRHNRFLTIVQYCLDISLALTELLRVCTPTARILLILGRQSNVHKTPFYNADIVLRVATELVGLHLVFQQERVFTNRYGQRIFEDILHLCPDPLYGAARFNTSEGARAIGREVLLEALPRVPQDRRMYLEEAIRGAEEVNPSPFFDPNKARPGSLSQQEGCNESSDSARR